jgi:SAM-dependent methyltransferase
MADETTLRAYDGRAAEFAADFRQIEPLGLYDTAQAFFRRGGRSVDVGCGCGRDVAWLHANGFPAEGVDASSAMLYEARAAFPNLPFEHSELPDLAGIPADCFDNVLCSAVLMHLGRGEIPGALDALARILRVGGRVIFSCRGGRDGAEREPDGRLFTRITPVELEALLESAGLTVLLSHHDDDTGRPGVVWHVCVAEKLGAQPDLIDRQERRRQ